MYQIPLSNDLIVDNFAGGGGASCGIEMALQRPVNIAINHDPEAIGMHEANHPLTKHYCENVWDVNPAKVAAGRPILLAWFSPDCKHFSKAKGGRPVEKKIRGLAWVALRWASLPKPQRPKIICLENVEEFVTWGPLVDGRPCPKNKGRTFNSFVNALKRHGYKVEWRELRACDYGVPTIRKRLFLIARCDGLPIVWPEPTHGPDLIPYRTAAECIDWSIPCPSIFERKRPLAENTMKRIAKGIQKFVIEAQEPFILNLTHGGRLEPLTDPFKTITGAQRGEKALVMPYLTEHANASNQRIFAADEPLRTQCAQVKGGHFALCAAFLAKHFGGVTGVGVDTPMPTILSRGTQTQIVTSHMMKMRGSSERAKHGHAMGEPAKSKPAAYKMPDGWDTGPGAHGSFHRNGRQKGTKSDKQRGHGRRHAGFNDRWDQMSKAEQQINGHNIRNVWEISPHRFRDAHFATFPPELAKRCILAGCPKDGVVFDPFGGAGTTGLVSDRLGRDAILIELNEEYIDMAKSRIQNDNPMFAEVVT